MVSNNRKQRMSEKKFVEESFLSQLEKMVDGPGWNVLRLGSEQIPSDTGREYFSEVLLPLELKKSLQTINPWLEVDQLDELMSRIANFNKSSLLENNKEVLQLL